MNLAVGSLTLLGFLILALGAVSKLMGMSLLTPFISSYFGYFIVANSCILTAIVIDRFQKS